MTNTTDHIAVVRDALKQYASLWTADDNAAEAKQSLSAIEANYLPLNLLPEGWHIENFCMNESGEFLILLMDNGEATAIGIGKTPNAAFMAAVEKVRE